MWGSKSYAGKKGEDNGLVAVAIDKDKGSQYAIRWAIDHLLGKGRAIVLIHVATGSAVAAGSSAIVATSSPNTSPSAQQQVDKQTKELFLSFRCFCTRKDIRCIDVTLKDSDVARALIEYANYAAIEHLVLGVSRGGFIRKFKLSDIPSMVTRGAPDFCNIYVIYKSKIASVRNASRQVPYASPLQSYLETVVKDKSDPSTPVAISSAASTPVATTPSATPPQRTLSIRGERPTFTPTKDDKDMSRFDRINERLMFSDYPESDTDISFVGSDRTSIERLSMQYDCMDREPRFSNSSDNSFGSLRSGQKLSDRPDSFLSQESGRTSASSQPSEETEAEMRKLRRELRDTMQMYNKACEEAGFLSEEQRQQAMELHRKRIEGDKNLEHTGMFSERFKSGRDAEQLEETKVSIINSEYAPSHGSIRYRKYSIEEIETATDCFSNSLKIGEGGYGPVFKCYLDHTKVAVKVLRPDAAQGRSQFQQEVEVLSCIRHPNMVLLLGACPEYGCIVYEYMANGSLDDRLFCRGKTPPLSWQVRFQIAADIATGLNFLHQTKPEPLVHRDLKPGNILLDRYFVAKIGDVGLARLVPPSVADQITQYCMTSAAGTFCYIDPEYQQTGMLGVKSDVYSFGILVLQLITAKPPMGLAHQVEDFIEKGKFPDILDPSVRDWPINETLSLAKIATQCAELRRKDRPDLGNDILPELERLRDYADERSHPFMFFAASNPSPMFSQTSMSQTSDSMSVPSGTMTPASSTQSPRVPDADI